MALMTRPLKNDKGEIDKASLSRRLSGGDELLKGFLLVHESCAKSNATNATPRRYMAFLRTYEELYKKKKEAVEIRKKHLQVRSITG